MEHTFTAQFAPSAVVADAASAPDLTFITVSAFTQVNVMVVPVPRTAPPDETSVRPLTVVKVATAPAATGMAAFASIVILNAPPVV